jgi:hypothetical protein
MSSIWSTAELVSKSETLLGDALAYAGAAGLGQTVSHLTLTRDQKLPGSWPELWLRYAAGCSVIYGALLTYALKRPGISARQLLLIHGAILGGCGVSVGLLHLADDIHARAVAQAMDPA